MSITAEDLADLLSQCDDPEVAMSILDSYNSANNADGATLPSFSPVVALNQRVEPWDRWDPEHASNLLGICLAEVHRHMVLRFLRFRTDATDGICAALDLLGEVEGDMPAWREGVAALRRLMEAGWEEEPPSEVVLRAREASLRARAELEAEKG